MYKSNLRASFCHHCKLVARRPRAISVVRIVQHSLKKLVSRYWTFSDYSKCPDLWLPTSDLFTYIALFRCRLAASCAMLNQTAMQRTIHHFVASTKNATGVDHGKLQAVETSASPLMSSLG